MRRLLPRGTVVGMDRDDGLRSPSDAELREALHRAALDVVEERGLAAATADEIAARAGVSALALHGCFPTVEAAVLGLAPRDVLEAAAVLRRRPPEERPLESLRHTVTALLAAAPADPSLRARRRRVLAVDPALAGAEAAFRARVQSCLTAVLAERLGASRSDVRVRLAVAASVAAVHASLAAGEEGP